MTLHVAHDGASMTVSRIDARKQEGELVYARNPRRELFVVVRSDVFAVALEGESERGQGRPARGLRLARLAVVGRPRRPRRASSGCLPWRALGALGAPLGWLAGSALRIRRAHVEGAMRAAGVDGPCARRRARCTRRSGTSAVEFLWLARRGARCDAARHHRRRRRRRAGGAAVARRARRRHRRVAHRQLGPRGLRHRAGRRAPRRDQAPERRVARPLLAIDPRAGPGVTLVDGRGAPWRRGAKSCVAGAPSR